MTIFLHPSPAGGGWLRATREDGWGRGVAQHPTRPPSAATLPEDGEG
jgi:hypothetical protein